VGLEWSPSSVGDSGPIRTPTVSHAGESLYVGLFNKHIIVRMGGTVTLLAGAKRRVWHPVHVLSMYHRPGIRVASHSARLE